MASYRVDHTMPEHVCPKCGHKLNAVQAFTDDREPPAVGDVSVCGYCAALLVFEVGGSREATADDLAALSVGDRANLHAAAGMVRASLRGTP